MRTIDPPAATQSMSEPLVGCSFSFFECHAAIEIEHQHALTSIGDRLRHLSVVPRALLSIVMRTIDPPAATQ